jgi:hypothetical protein
VKHRPLQVRDGILLTANVHQFTEKGKLGYTETTRLLDSPFRTPAHIEAAGVAIETFIAAVLR